MASPLSEIIRAEIESSQRERRDFSFTSTVKMQLMDTYGLGMCIFWLSFLSVGAQRTFSADEKGLQT
jgi:hypothetical protein